MPPTWSSVLLLLCCLTSTLVYSAFAAPKNDVETVVFDGIQSDWSIGISINHIFHRARSHNRTVTLSLFANTQVGFRLSKCDRTLLATWKDVQSLSIQFQDKIVDWLLSVSSRHCYGEKEDDSHRFRLDMYPSRPTRGKMVFSLGPRNSAIDYSNKIGPYFVNNTDNQILNYKGSFSSSLLNAKFNHSVYLVTNLTSPVKVGFGKCGLKLEDVLSLKGNGKTDLSRGFLDKIRFLSDIICIGESENYGFEILLTTVFDTNGAFGFLIVRPSNLNELEAFIIFGSVVAVFFLLCICCCCCCCRKCFSRPEELPTSFGTRQAMDIYREHYALQVIGQQYDSHGEPVFYNFD